MCISHAHFEANNLRGGIKHLRDRAKALALFACLERGTNRARDHRESVLCHESWEKCKDFLKAGDTESVKAILAAHNITLKQPKGK